MPASCSGGGLQCPSDTTIHSPKAEKRTPSARRQVRQRGSARAQDRASAQARVPARALPPGTAQTHQYGGTPLREPFSQRPLTVSANRIRPAIRRDGDVAGSFAILRNGGHKFTQFLNWYPP